MKQIVWLALCAAVMIVGCDEDETPPPPVPSMTILEAPAFLAANSDSCYEYRVRLAHAEAESVLVEVRAPDGTVHSTFALYDDGGAGSAYPAYACAGSGDIAPNNGTYTRRVNAQRLSAGTTGTWTFRFAAAGMAEQRAVQIQNAEPCLLFDLSGLTQLATCFAPQTLQLRVRPSEFDVVDSVWLELDDPATLEPASVLYFAPYAADTLWRAQLTPRFFKCIDSPAENPYRQKWVARTRFGMECVITVNAVEYANSLPVLSNSTLPDTAYRPTADSTIIAVTVDMEDCELEGATDFLGAADFPGVKFDVRRDENPWPPSRPADFFMRDDGVAPDQLAGDGRYSSWLVIPHFPSLPDNMYYFRFYAVDCAAPNDTSEFLLDSIRIIQSTGALAAGGDLRAAGGTNFPVLD